MYSYVWQISIGFIEQNTVLHGISEWQMYSTDLVSDLWQNYTSAIILHSQQKVKPCPSDIMIFQGGNNQAKVPNVFQILLLVSFVAHFHRNFWNFYVYKQFVLLCSFL